MFNLLKLTATIALLACWTATPARAADDKTDVKGEEVKKVLASFVTAWAKRDKPAAKALCLGNAAKDVEENFEKSDFSEKHSVDSVKIQADGYAFVKAVLHASTTEEEKKPEPIRFMVVMKPVDGAWKITYLNESWNEPLVSRYTVEP